MTPGTLPPPLAPGERPDAPVFAEAAGQVLIRELGAALRGKRLLLALILAGLPVGVTMLLASPDPVSLVRAIVQVQLRFLVPLIAVSLGSGLLYDEAEEGTLTYLFTSPISRASVVLGKWAAALGLGWALVLSSLWATLLVSPVDTEALAPLVKAGFQAVLLGYPAYLGVFLLLGTLFRRGFLVGLLYAFGYELVLGFIPGSAKLASLTFYLNSLVIVHAPDDAPFEGALSGMEPAAAGTCLGVLMTVALAGLALSLVVTQGKEFQTRNVQG